MCILYHHDRHTTHSETVAALDTLRFTPGRNTNTQDALRLANSRVFTYSRGDRPEAENVVVVITDGRSNVRAHETLRQASSLLRIHVARFSFIT